MYLIGTELVVNTDLKIAFSGKHQGIATVFKNRTI